jgi:predicted AlkP superfamily pyrophosphatase or phosphodiesterase
VCLFERYWNKFSSDGIKKLYTKGFVCKNAYFEQFPTYTGPGHSTIYTGCDPGLHGIVANDWYDRVLGKEVYCTDVWLKL